LRLSLEMSASDGWSAMHAPLASLANNANAKVEEAKKISDFEYVFDYSPLNINCQNIDWALPTRCDVGGSRQRPFKY